MKIRVCDLSVFVGEAGDVSDYFALPGKNRPSFTNEILWKARIGKPFSDLPDFVRQQIHSEKFRSLKPLDRLLYFELIMRVSRHYVRTGPINGLRVLIKPGEYLTSVAKLVEICEFYSEKQMRNAIKRLTESGLLTRKNLKMKRGSIFGVIGWPNNGGQTEWHSESWAQELLDFPVPPLDKAASEG